MAILAAQKPRFKNQKWLYSDTMKRKLFACLTAIIIRCDALANQPMICLNMYDFGTISSESFSSLPLFEGEEQGYYDYSTPISDTVTSGYLRAKIGRGLGNIDSYETAGLYHDWNADRFQPFVSVEGHWLRDKQWAASAGLGLRYIDDDASAVYGINGYCDYLWAPQDTSQLGLGLECGARHFDIVANLYLQLGAEEVHVGEPLFIEYDGGYFAYRAECLERLNGGDIELGTNWNRWWWIFPFDLYVGAGLYQYRYRKDNEVAFTGQRYRIELTYLDLVTIGLIGTRDGMFQDALQALIQINISFDDCGFVFCRDLMRVCFLNGVTGHPPRRQDVIIRPDSHCCWETNF